jgi:hypothetical protein
MSLTEVNRFIDLTMAGITPDFCPDDLLQERFKYRFPEDKKKIAKLSLEQKMEWYAHHIQVNARTGSVPLGLISKEFMSFWKWRVLIPLKIMRFAYKVKNWQFKKHSHISEIRENLKKNAHLI